MPGKLDNFAAGIVSGIPTGVYARNAYDERQYNKSQRKTGRQAIDAMIDLEGPAAAPAPGAAIPEQQGVPQQDAPKQGYATRRDHLETLKNLTAQAYDAGDVATASNIVAGYVGRQSRQYLQYMSTANDMLQNGDYDQAVELIAQANASRIDGVGFHGRATKGGVMGVRYDEETGEPIDTAMITPDWLQQHVDYYADPAAKSELAGQIMGARQAGAEYQGTLAATAKDQATANKYNAEAAKARAEAAGGGANADQTRKFIQSQQKRIPEFYGEGYDSAAFTRTQADVFEKYPTQVQSIANAAVAAGDIKPQEVDIAGDAQGILNLYQVPAVAEQATSVILIRGFDGNDKTSALVLSDSTGAPITIDGDLAVVRSWTSN